MSVTYPSVVPSGIHHVALNMFALRIQAATQGQHVRRYVHERAGQRPLQVRGIVPAAAAEIASGERLDSGW